MNDRRVPGWQGDRQPILLSSAAVHDLKTLETQPKESLAAGLRRLARGAFKGKDLLIGSLGEQGYKYIDAGDVRAVYREMSPDELMKQGYAESLARHGGIFVVDILPVSQFREALKDL